MEINQIEQGINELTQRFLYVKDSDKDKIKDFFEARKKREEISKLLAKIRNGYWEMDYNGKEFTRIEVKPLESLVDDMIKVSLKGSKDKLNLRGNNGYYIKWDSFRDFIHSRAFDFGHESFKLPKITVTEFDIANGLVTTAYTYRNQDGQYYTNLQPFTSFPAIPLHVIAAPLLPDIDFTKGHIRVPFMKWFRRGLEIQSLPEDNWHFLADTQNERNAIRYTVARSYSGETDSLVGRMESLLGLQAAILENFNGTDAVEREKTLARNQLVQVLSETISTQDFHQKAIQLCGNLEREVRDLERKIANAKADKAREAVQNRIDNALDHNGFVDPNNTHPVVFQLKKVSEAVKAIGEELLATA